VLGTNHSEIQALIDVSARLGHDPLLVQAGSGNTSVKLDDVLWIKASGKWLEHAALEEFLVPVALVEIRSCIQRKMEFVAQYTSPSGHRLVPSIETAMHAAVPRPATIHVHSVNTIAWAVREDGPAHLADRLAGLRWQWIPYVGSGLPLAREVEKIFSNSPETKILILGNHGLVVCGEHARAAEELFSHVEKRLAIEPRRSPEPDRALLQRIARGSMALTGPRNSACSVDRYDLANDTRRGNSLSLPGNLPWTQHPCIGLLVSGVRSHRAI